MPYCEVPDLLIGDITVSAALDPEKYVNDAADEIDSKIGFRYLTPVPNTAPRPVLLLLKRVNSHLASGRLILAATISAEMEELNAYGANLVADAELTLAAIASGEMKLPGTELAPEVVVVDPTNPLNGPVLIDNLDPVSQVESFYNILTNPSSLGYFPVPYRAGSGG